MQADSGAADAGRLGAAGERRVAAHRGRRVAGVGESGSGKTMLALALMGLLPPGCAFEPRCALRRAECAQRVPDLRVANPDHFARCILID